jgi:hypothetical protein
MSTCTISAETKCDLPCINSTCQIVPPPQGGCPIPQCVPSKQCPITTCINNSTCTPNRCIFYPETAWECPFTKCISRNETLACPAIALTCEGFSCNGKCEIVTNEDYPCSTRVCTAVSGAISNSFLAFLGLFLLIY